MDQDEEEDHIKEVCAHFGLAYYASNVFEAGLAIAIMQLDFLRNLKTSISQKNSAKISRPEYERQFDKFMQQQHDKSLGNLIKKINQFDEIGDDLKCLMQEVKTKRDFLAHHFFRERDMDFFSSHGRDRLICELEYARELFKKADVLLDHYMKPTLDEYGFTEEMEQEMYAKLLQEARSER